MSRLVEHHLAAPGDLEGDGAAKATVFDAAGEFGSSGPQLRHSLLNVIAHERDLVMLADAVPDHGHPLETPGAYMLHLQVDDVDAWWKRAVEAGAEALMPVSEKFWGDRYGQLRDPFGIKWSIATPIRKS